jgi:formylglycine-generating enzyme required for sulfatase activity
MAPEQWQGKESEATDQYALGVVLYELITGQKPYQADTPAAVAIRQATEPLHPPSQLVGELPEVVEKILFKALAIKPEDRYEDMKAFQGALEGLLAYEDTSAPKTLKAASSNPILINMEGAESRTYDTIAPTPRDIVSKAGGGKKRSLKKTVTWIGVMALLIGLVFGGILLLNDETISSPLPVAFLATDTSVPVATKAAPTHTPNITATQTRTPTEISTNMPTQVTIPVIDEMVNPIDGAEMVYVPEGEFIMGSEIANLYNAPEHIVFLDAYWIYQHEVTNANFRSCVEADVCNGDPEDFPKDDYPVVSITWHEASGYCKWARGRLPTEAEWEKAARGTDGRNYPWGSETPNCNLHGYCEGISPVGNYLLSASPYGALDMFGNVAEWTADWYDEDYYHQSPTYNPKGPAVGDRDQRVIRGYLWEIWQRLGGTPVSRDFYTGFRCVYSVEP